MLTDPQQREVVKFLGLASNCHDINLDVYSATKQHEVTLFVDGILAERQQKWEEQNQMWQQLQSEIDKMSECQANRVIDFLKRDLAAPGDFYWFADSLAVDLSTLTLGRQRELLAFVMGITAELPPRLQPRVDMAHRSHDTDSDENLFIPGLPSPVGSDCSN